MQDLPHDIDIDDDNYEEWVKSSWYINKKILEYDKKISFTQ